MQRFIARQPILTQKLALLGYELLFRRDSNNAATDSPHATSHVIEASTMLFGWEKLVGHGLGFINFGQEELLNGAALLLPHRQAVIELPTEAGCGEEVLHACENLHRAKYRIALDNFRDEDERSDLVPLADFLKVDFRATSGEEQRELSYKYTGGHVALVATRVETWEEFQRARTLQFRHFQGSFFLEPRMMERQDIAGRQASALRLLQAAQQHPMDYRVVENLLKQEPALTVKLLRYLNSPIMARPAEITSVPMAISLLGEEEFRRWATLVAVVTPAEEKPSELVRTALMRAFFCEEIGRLCDRRHGTFEFFLVGLLSVMSGILDRPLADILDELAISPRVQAALLGEDNELRRPLDAVLAYERGDWEAFSGIMGKLALAEELVPDCFMNADQTVKSLLS